MLNALQLLDHLFASDCGDHLSDDVQWVLPVSLPAGVGGVHNGRTAVMAMLERVTTRFYDPQTISLDVSASFGTDQFATRIFTVNAKSRWGQTYRNFYSMTIQAENGKIARVYEFCDTKHLYDTMDLHRADQLPSQPETS